MTGNGIAMRDAIIDELYHIASNDRRVIFVTDDFGAPSLDRFRRDLGDQYICIGIAEQNMVSVSAGLALGGKIVFMYAIAPFVSLRCFEQIKIDLCCMDLPVTGLGVGSGYGYSTAGPTHHATEDLAVMRTLPRMTILNPSDSWMAARFAKMACSDPGPKYIRIERDTLPSLYQGRRDDFTDGLIILETGKDVTIVASGIMVHRALEVREALARDSIDAGVVDLYRIQPLNDELLLEALENSGKAVTLEENRINGGIGTIIAELLVDNDSSLPLKRIAIPNQYCFEYGKRDYLHGSCGLDVDSVTKKIEGLF